CKVECHSTPRYVVVVVAGSVVVVVVLVVLVVVLVVVVVVVVVDVDGTLAAAAPHPALAGPHPPLTFAGPRGCAATAVVMASGRRLRTSARIETRRGATRARRDIRPVGACWLQHRHHLTRCRRGE